MQNKKIIVSAFIILLWAFTFARVDITGKVINDYSSKGAGFFPILSAIFLLLSLGLVWHYLKDEEFPVK